LFYPLLTYERYGTEYRWQLGQLFSLAGGQESAGFRQKALHRVPDLFPATFAGSQMKITPRSSLLRPSPEPVVSGQNFLRDVSDLQRDPQKGCRHRQLSFSLFDLRHGDGMHGWQFWPLVGTEHKDVTTQTNGFGDVETSAVTTNFFALWPIHFWQNTASAPTTRKNSGPICRFTAIRARPTRFDLRVLAVFHLD
jgi:hypothetical protein